MIRLLQGDCREVLKTLAVGSVHCVVTSPPYLGLRDYGTATWDGGDTACDHTKGQLVSGKSTLRSDGRDHVGPYDCEKAISTGMPFRNACGKCGAVRTDSQIGLEASPDAYVAEMVSVFREVWRVLRDDGTAWLNLGDSYANDAKWGGSTGGKHVAALHGDTGIGREKRVTGMKAKDLMMIPARVALALQADGWYLRSDIIWAKKNCMPESVTDRPSQAHEHVFLLTKRPKYFYDAEAIREEGVIPAGTRAAKGSDVRSDLKDVNGRPPEYWDYTGTRNSRNVWSIATQPFPDAHFATFPPELAERCIKAGTSEKGCCAACGAPWARTTDKVDTGRTQKMADGWDTSEGGHGTIHRNGREKGAVGVPVMATVTTGWSPTCQCAAPVVPCVVLDCFSGAGTTALVADRLGRSAIGIELNEAYNAIARKRLEKDAGLFAEVS